MSSSELNVWQHRTNRDQSTNNGRAFTLIELLVVISIIALLISILLPALRSARLSSQSLMAKTNLKQIGVVASIYADQTKGMWPASAYNGEMWFTTLAKIMQPGSTPPILTATDHGQKLRGTIFYTPLLEEAIPSNNVQGDPLPPGGMPRSFGWNSSLEYWDSLDYGAQRKYHQRGKPSRTILVGDSYSSSQIDATKLQINPRMDFVKVHFVFLDTHVNLVNHQNDMPAKGFSWTVFWRGY